MEAAKTWVEFAQRSVTPGGVGEAGKLWHALSGRALQNVRRPLSPAWQTAAAVGATQEASLALHLRLDTDP